MHTRLDIGAQPARHQPRWDDAGEVRRVRRELARRAPLVRAEDVLRLSRALACVARGEAHVLQAGDCAEDPAERTAHCVARKTGLLEKLAGVLTAGTGKPVVRVGRIAGQFGKPRSRPVERIGHRTLPVYQGHMVNGPEFDPASRRPDPRRLIGGYEAAGEIMRRLPRPSRSGTSGSQAPVWSSHEALLLDYELPLVRDTAGGRLLLSSTHWPWVGERTRQVDGAHVALLASVTNPVACKIGPQTTTAELRALCARLDPERVPGRLTLIARMGAKAVSDRLPPLVEAARVEGHPVIWLTDPMHANTGATPGGSKTRSVRDIVQELQEFQSAVSAADGVAGGLHLETTPDDVRECIWEPGEPALPGSGYTSLCDPRLNPRQAIAVVSAWTAETAGSTPARRGGTST